MSLHGINGSPLPSLGSLVRPETSRTSNDRGVANGSSQGGQQGVASHATDRAAAAQAAAVARPPLKPQTPIAGQGATGSTVPPEAPAGTDPTLWSVLTTEERNFFAKTAAMGPLTYGRIKAGTSAAPPAARGVRLDVRA